MLIFADDCVMLLQCCCCRMVAVSCHVVMVLSLLSHRCGVVSSSYHCHVIAIVTLLPCHHCHRIVAMSSSSLCHHVVVVVVIALLFVASLSHHCHIVVVINVIETGWRSQDKERIQASKGHLPPGEHRQTDKDRCLGMKHASAASAAESRASEGHMWRAQTDGHVRTWK